MVRVIVVGGIALVVSLFVVLGYNSDTSDQGRQEVTAEVRRRPAPGSIAAPQADIEVSGLVRLTGVLVLNGAPTRGSARDRHRHQHDHVPASPRAEVSRLARPNDLASCTGADRGRAA